MRTITSAMDWTEETLAAECMLGNLPIGYQPEGNGCPNGAEVAVELEHDEAPGPRFYCRPCAIEYLVKHR